MDLGTMYVIGEDLHVGPVKIGITYNAGGKVGRGGLNAGNWRELVLLHRVEVDRTVVRWQEWLIHHRLRHRHVRGEWFDVRDLADGDWGRFLRDLASGNAPYAHPQPLGAPGHEVTVARQPDAPSRHFEISCSCGATFDGGRDTSLPSALVRFAVDHAGLPKTDAVVRDLRVEPSSRRYALRADR